MNASRPRRSAKTAINEYATELMNRQTDPDAHIKLRTLFTIATRMSWNDVRERIDRFLNSKEEQRRQPWWVK